MVSLYVTSIERHAGKKLITMGLIDRMRRDGLKVGYFKPVGHSPIKVDDVVTDRGAWLLARLFGLEDPIEFICPVIITQDLIMQNYERGVTGLQERIEGAFEKVCQQKDVVVVGCDNNFSEGSSLGVSGTQLIRFLNARAVFVERYACDFCIDFLIELKKVIGDAMTGVVFNRVLPLHREEIEELVSPFLNRQHLDLFGALPYDTLLGSTQVTDLVEHLSADVVCGKNQLDGLVENFLVGGMQVDKFITYLLKSPGSGIIVGGDRTDIQLVAIENGVRCLILSGSLYPNDTIITRAEAKGVPILVVRDDTFTVAKKVEAMAGQFRLRNREKIDHGIKLVDETLDFRRLYERLELK